MRDAYTFRDLIAPLGLMFLLGIPMAWLTSKGGDEVMLGILMMYISYVITYFTFIKPRLKLIKEKTFHGDKR